MLITFSSYIIKVQEPQLNDIVTEFAIMKISLSNKNTKNTNVTMISIVIHCEWIMGKQIRKCTLGFIYEKWKKIKRIFEGMWKC